MRALQDLFGNASSVHYYGQQAKAAIDDARSAVAALIGAEPSEIIFTSGGTEADNFAIRGRRRGARADRPQAPHHLGHRARGGPQHVQGAREARMADDRAAARRQRHRVARSAARGDDRRHRARLDHAREQRNRHDSADCRAGGDRARARRALSHRCRAERRQDSGERAGARRRSARRVGPQVLRARRASARCGRSAACACRRFSAAASRSGTGGPEPRTCPARSAWGSRPPARCRKWTPTPAAASALRDRLENGILSSVPNTDVNGSREARVPNTTNISFDRIEAESLLIALDLEGVAVSTGSACSSGTLEPSHVLKAMNLSSHRAQNSIRFSLGASNTEEQIDHVIEILPRIVTKLRSLSAVGPGLRSLSLNLLNHENCCRHVGRRRLVGRRRAAGRSGPRGHRSVHAALRPARRRVGLRKLLQPRRSPRRRPRRPPPQHPPLHRQFRARVSADGRVELRRASTSPAARRFPARTATAI